MTPGSAQAAGTLGNDEIERIVAGAVPEIAPDGKRIVVLVPDLTRSAPIPQLFRILADHLAPRAKRLDFMVALGTHPPLDEPQIARLVGMEAAERAGRFPNVAVINHEWGLPDALEKIGQISRDEVADATGGLLSEDVDIVLNRRVLREYDEILICGPVFPHEVVGFSGGNKYLFPGVSGAAFLQFFHWIGALLTNPRVNGNQWTPVRRFIDRAARLVPLRRRAFCFVVTENRALAALCFGEVEDAWSRAVDVSRRLHVRYLPRPFDRVLAEAPAMYDDLWVGGKCMYKLEPIVADGGELVIHAPHIREVSFSHGRILDEIGYHTRDYFVAQWDRFRHHPWGVVAHSTHVRGIGTYAGGVERPRIRVTLATGIPEERCRRIGLGYRDPASIRPEEWDGREAEGILRVRHAGEILYRLSDPPEWQQDGGA